MHETSAQGWCRGIGWGGRWEGGSGWGIHVNPWLIHVNVWQKPLWYCKVISLQLIKINEKKNNSNILSEISNYFVTMWLNLVIKAVIKSLPPLPLLQISYVLWVLAGQTVKNPSAMQETWVRSLGWEGPLEKGKATHSSNLAWRIPWTEEPARLQSMGLQSWTRLSDFFSFILWRWVKQTFPQVEASPLHVVVQVVCLVQEVSGGLSSPCWLTPEEQVLFANCSIQRGAAFSSSYDGILCLRNTSMWEHVDISL